MWPIAVDTFSPVNFTYVVRPTLGTEDLGFDRLEILTHTRARALRSVIVDAVPVPFSLDDNADYPAQILDDRIIISFPKMAGAEDSFKQIQVDFDASVLRFGTRFSSWIYDSNDPNQIKQAVQPGNASYRFSSDTFTVRTPIGGRLFVDISAKPRVFTPNGDGVNDALTIAYKLREVTDERPVSVRIFDLSGAQMAALAPLPSRSGEFSRQWDGRDSTGRLLPPGTYIYQISMDTVGNHEQVGVISMAY